MFYAIISTDAEGTLAKRLEARPAHVERLKALADEGRLLIAGPHPAVDNEDPGDAGFTGSLDVGIIARPGFSAGVYESVVVKPFRKVLP